MMKDTDSVVTRSGEPRREMRRVALLGVYQVFLRISPGRDWVVRDGVDPSTSGFSDRRSTD